jgi:hypothetical protein
MLLDVFISDAERLNRNKVFENPKNICLRLDSREWKKRVISMGYNPIVITVHHNRRDCVAVCGSCCI